MMSRLLALPLAAGFAVAADTEVRGPVLGHVFDAAAASVREISGIPGAALVTGTVASSLSSAVISPSGDILGISEGRAVRIKAGTREQTAFTDAALAADSIVLSRSGNSAAIFSRSTGTIQIFTGLASEPKLLRELHAGALDAIALSDDGATLLYASPEDDGSALYANSTRLLKTGKISAIAFFPRSQDAVIADGSAGQVHLLRGGSEISLLAAVEQPSAVAASDDGATAYVASANRKAVTSIRIADGTANTLECTCAPRVLTRLAAPGAFQLTTDLNAPIWLYDASGSEPRIYFVPQPEAATIERGEGQ